MSLQNYNLKKRAMLKKKTNKKKKGKKKEENERQVAVSSDLNFYNVIWRRNTACKDSWNLCG